MLLYSPAKLTWNKTTTLRLEKSPVGAPAVLGPRPICRGEEAF